MAKKQFTNNFQDIFTPTEAHPPKKEVVNVPDQDDDKIQRTTLLLRRKTYKTIKALAYWERKQIKDIIEEGIAAYLSKIDANELEKAIIHFEANSEKPTPQEYA
mgnify:CR=1 FL=1